MHYHINTGLILEKFNRDCSCPLCEIEKVVEDKFVYEFLNDAVMEESTRLKVNKLGFCGKHYDKLLAGQNKLSLAIQISSRIANVKQLLNPVSPFRAKAVAKQLERENDSCIICNLIKDSMKKYYKTVAQMYNYEPDFYKSLLATNGFCVHHYAMLLKYAKYAGRYKKDYVELLSKIQKMSMTVTIDSLQEFCYSNDQNSGMPLGDCEDALKKTRERLYGKKE